MSEKAKKQAKNAAQKKQAKPQNQVLYSCVVIEDNTKIGAMLCLAGTKANLPKDKAEALKQLGKVKIEGVA